MTPFRTLLITLACLGFSAGLVAAPPNKYVDVRIEGKSHIGTVTAHTDTDFWLLERDGRLNVFPTADVSDYQPLPGRMRPFTAAELRSQLILEFGHDYEVTGSTHYLVADANGQSEQYASLFEELYRHTFVYFSARGFHIHEPEFPMIAIVFPDQEAFSEYCMEEKVNPQPGLVGYYMPSSNRVALYDSTSSGRSETAVDSTIIHEAVHQAAFNLGLHRRIGETPLWVVEGLAMTFESENFRNPVPGMSPASRINPERYARFQNLMSQRKQTKSLEDLIKDDQLFKTATLDAYARSWALTFYLLQTRESQYSQYLKLINARPLLSPYPPEARLADFRKIFGKDLNQLELQLVRYMNELTEKTEYFDPPSE
ncbi:MAG: DUF1570 domain-containing protein [Planctomycetaceae bacterium]